MNRFLVNAVLVLTQWQLLLELVVWSLAYWIILLSCMNRFFVNAVLPLTQR